MLKPWSLLLGISILILFGYAVAIPPSTDLLMFPFYFGRCVDSNGQVFPFRGVFTANEFIAVPNDPLSRIHLKGSFVGNCYDSNDNVIFANVNIAFNVVAIPLVTNEDDCSFISLLIPVRVQQQEYLFRTIMQLVFDAATITEPNNYIKALICRVTRMILSIKNPLEGDEGTSAYMGLAQGLNRLLASVTRIQQ